MFADAQILVLVCGQEHHFTNWIIKLVIVNCFGFSSRNLTFYHLDIMCVRFFNPSFCMIEIYHLYDSVTLDDCFD